MEPSTDPTDPRAAPTGLGRRSFLLGAAALGVAACRGSGGSDAVDVEPVRVRYGPHAPNVADLWLPAKPSRTPMPVVMFLHGGYWRPTGDRTLMSPLARASADRGWAAWNVEYRAVGQGGGWPTTHVDVARAIDHLAALAPAHDLDLDRVAVVGHSAGGPLSLWTAFRSKQAAGAPGRDPKVRPSVVASQAGVNNLRAGVFEHLGNQAVVQFMGAEPEEAPVAYRNASPAENLPLGTPQVIVYGTADMVVPASQSVAYAGKAKRAGDDVTLLAIKGADHFDLIDPAQAGWKRLSAALAEVLDA